MKRFRTSLVAAIAIGLLAGSAVGVAALTGEAGYDGLSLFMSNHEGAASPWGVIVASDAIPPYPELPVE